MTTEQIEEWMLLSGVKRIVSFDDSYGVYLNDHTFGTGCTLSEAVADAEARARK